MATLREWISSSKTGVQQLIFICVLVFVPAWLMQRLDLTAGLWWLTYTPSNWVKPWSLKMSHSAAEQVALFLGADSDHTYIAIMEDEVGLTDVNWASLRDVGAALSAKDVGLATAAVALAAWHEGHQFCPKCGE